jgi:hypothetical protein
MLIILASSITNILSQNVTPSSGVILDITVRDSNGKIISHMHEVNDLILSNHARMMAMIFHGSASGMQVKSTTGVWFIPGSLSSYINFVFSSTDSKIWIGTGTSSAAFTNYKLDTSYASFNPSLISYHWNGVGTYPYNLTISGVYTATGSASIAESGLSANLENSANAFYLDVMVLRDVFSPFAITTGNVITVKYTWILNG